MVSAAVVLVFLVGLAIVNAELDPFVTVSSSPFKITPIDPTEALTIQPYTVNGARDCGGRARSLQLTYDNCKPSAAVTCVAEINDKPSNGVIYFIAAEDATDLAVRATVITEGNEPISVVVPIPNTSLIRGHFYAVYSSGKIEPELRGIPYTGRGEVLSGAEKKVQVCGETDFIAYQP